MDAWWIGPLRSAFADRPVVVAGAMAAAWADRVELLRSLGAERLLVVATEGRGAGPMPDATMVVVDPPAGLSMMERLRWATRTLSDPPTDIRVAVEDFDPDHRAVVVGPFLNESPVLLDRSFLAFRRREWIDLEDKTVIDAFWDRAGIERAPSVVVPIVEAVEASAALDLGSGTVWAADARDGYHGGGAGTRWVVGEQEMRAAGEELGDIADAVRIMPFLEGVPCSIHGIVLPDGTAVLRPVEMVVLRRSHQLVYAGCGTYWDPTSTVREQMRSVARRAGEQLRHDVDFRGAFTVDGVVTAAGFLPTELNPRPGAGLITLERATGVPLLALSDLVIASHRLGSTAATIEADLVRRADAHRSGGTWIPTLPVEIEPVDRAAARRPDGSWTWADDDAASGSTGGVASVVGGGHFLRCLFDAASTPNGPSIAPAAAAFWSFADAELATDVGPLTASR